MLVCTMHPTVLHEDSKLLSADFPGLALQILQQEFVGTDCAVLHHTGPCGNQSPRHVTRSNTFEEAERLGGLLARAAGSAVATVEWTAQARLGARQTHVELPRRAFPSKAEAERKLQHARERLEELRSQGAPRRQVRTAEVDWFGAEETLVLARANASDEIEAVYRQLTPAEIQVLSVGPWRFAGWPGEVFVDYALEVKAERPDAFVIELANGVLQGYIVTPEAAQEGDYEASNALFSHEAGRVLVETTLALTASGAE